MNKWFADHQNMNVQQIPWFTQFYKLPSLKKKKNLINAIEVKRCSETVYVNYEQIQSFYTLFTIYTLSLLYLLHYP